MTARHLVGLFAPACGVESTSAQRRMSQGATRRSCLPPPRWMRTAAIGQGEEETPNTIKGPLKQCNLGQAKWPKPLSKLPSLARKHTEKKGGSHEAPNSLSHYPDRLRDLAPSASAPNDHPRLSINLTLVHLVSRIVPIGMHYESTN
jgi:hypothetical protein